MWEFKLSSIKDLKQLASELNVSIEASEDVSILAEPVKVGNLVIPNSLAVHPMEGCDGDSQGRPGKLTFRRYERFGAGGAGLLWAEAIAVAGEGRANPRQLWLNNANKESFSALVKTAREAAARSMGKKHRPLIVAQLTHSGRYSKPDPDGIGRPIIPQRDPYRDALIPQQKPTASVKSKLPDDYPIVTDEYLDKLIDIYVEAARIAFEVGFDAVDIKSCHGYLINELLASRNRSGKYGGSFENRTRFVLEAIDKIRNQLGEDKLIVSRLGIYDAIPYPYGWAVDRDDYTKPDLTEPKKLIALMAERGVKMMNITVANPYFNPHVGRPFNQPIVGGYEEPEHPLVGVCRLITLAGEIQKEFPNIAFVGTGYSWLRTLMANVGAANKANGLITLVGGGRMSFAYPDFAKDILNKGRLDENKVCVGCSACTQIMRDGGTTGCVVRDNKVYGPIFEAGRMSDKDNLLRLAAACRKCQEPTCQVACPAGVDIPKFIRLFLDGDEKGAYEAIRQANIFPEICAWLCPVEQQCEGSCLQGFIGDGPLPIADIQRYLARQANKNGWSKLRIPPIKSGSGKKIAVVGAGPAGLACAAKLLEAGHSVTLFDKSDEFGGMIESVIPADRQYDSLKDEISAIFKDVPGDRFVLQPGTELNDKFNLDTIIAKGFDAVFLGMGLPQAISPDSPDGIGEKVEGLFNAIEFLSAAKANSPDSIGTEVRIQNEEYPDFPMYRDEIRGKDVAVIGGGNTAMDAAVTAKQLGAKDVYIIYRRSFAEMPAWDAERERAVRNNVHFLILTVLLGINPDKIGGKLTSITVCPAKLAEPDSSGRRRPEPVKESAYNLDMDILIEAIGQRSAENIDKILNGVELEDGLVKINPDSYQTSREKVFAGGDLVHGASTVVAAVADGMKAAKSIDDFLKK